MSTIPLIKTPMTILIISYNDFSKLNFINSNWILLILKTTKTNIFYLLQVLRNERFVVVNNLCRTPVKYAKYAIYRKCEIILVGENFIGIINMFENDFIQISCS